MIRAHDHDPAFEQRQRERAREKESKPPMHFLTEIVIDGKRYYVVRTRREREMKETPSWEMRKHFCNDCGEECHCVSFWYGKCSHFCGEERTNGLRED